MEQALVLLGLLLLAFPIIAIVALVKTINIGDRLNRIESRFAALEAKLVTTATSEQQTALPVAHEAKPEPAEPSIPQSAPPPPPPPSEAAGVPATPLAATEKSGDLAGFEEKFGTRWTVWIGGVALALGGIFLVKYSIEAGLLGPGMRVFFGALLAAALVTGGEWARRQDQHAGIAGLPSAHIPSVLTAAGTTVAYATVYAAYALYNFLDPALAFVLLGAVALATLAAALLHGPALAALGLIGAYVTPLLVSTGHPNYWALYVYLAVVSTAAFALARIRLWRWLAITAVAFGLFWLLPGIGVRNVEALAPHLFHVIAGYALVAALIVSGLLYGPEPSPGEIDPVSSGTLSAYLLGALLLALASRHDPAALTVFTLLAAATVAIAWHTEAAAGAIPAAAVLASLVILHWSLETEIAPLIAPAGPAGAAAPQPLTTNIGPHLGLGALFAVLFGATGYLAQGRGRCPVATLLWSACSVATPLVILAALYWRITHFERSIPFAGLALLLAALNGIATEQLGKREPQPGLAASGALYAVGTVAALALALTFSLNKGWLTVALALMVPGVAWIANERPWPVLRWLAAAGVVLVVARIGWNPRIVGSDVGTTPIFNWLLYGYGVPAAAFWFAGRLLRRRADDQPTRMVESGAILFTVLAGFVEIRHFMNSGDVYRPSTTLGELALDVCSGLAMAIGLEHVRHRTHIIVHDVAALAIAAATACTIVLGLWLAENPMLVGVPVGGLFINLILLGYGIPAVLAIILAMQTRGVRPGAYRAIAAGIAVLLMLSYLTLEVRRFYHGPVLTAGLNSDAEQYTYSVVWLGYGVALLLFGFAFRSQPARLASAMIILLTVAKVFLLDMSGLTGVYRALSFIGLGLVLVGIGWLYQRLLLSPQLKTSAAPG